MTFRIWAKSLVLWLVILVLAMLNGALREKVLIPALGSFAGLVGSGVVLSICVFLVALCAAPWYGRLPRRQWWLIGMFWLLLTVGFEFGFGHFVQREPWSGLLEAYTFQGGNIWPLVLVVTLVSPRLAARLRGVG
ncbi:MAG TPA: hypothetical protein VEC56_05370 [Candidatus Krumholzibacteria bacterium]|nr:hypothetical protein [Candidatus Krumholzibacteria bacterium]